ncbi:UNVERIFIED_CONTAM: hypothetical protein FKN15_015846 [Acipenser sinensis]
MVESTRGNTFYEGVYYLIAIKHTFSEGVHYLMASPPLALKKQAAPPPLALKKQAAPPPLALKMAVAPPPVALETTAAPPPLALETAATFFFSAASPVATEGYMQLALPKRFQGGGGSGVLIPLTGNRPPGISAEAAALDMAVAPPLVTAVILSHTGLQAPPTVGLCPYLAQPPSGPDGSSHLLYFRGQADTIQEDLPVDAL